MDDMTLFLDIFGRLPRAGPGSTASTRRAWALMTDVPASPRVLDIGCGPGVQTVELLRLTAGQVVALDFLPLMVERTRALAAQAGVADRLTVLQQDMREMDFAPASFDVVWSEGAIYNLGFENGLNKVKPFVRPGGHVVVSEAVWLRPDPPEPVVAHWQEYPEIDTIAHKLAVIDRLGYTLQGNFVLPESDWTTDYYDPMERLLPQKAQEWTGGPDEVKGLAVIDEARREIAMYRQNSAWYGYACFVMKRRG